MGTTNEKSTIDTHTEKKKQFKHITEDRHQMAREENKKGREEKRLKYKIFEGTDRFG